MSASIAIKGRVGMWSVTIAIAVTSLPATVSAGVEIGAGESRRAATFVGASVDSVRVRLGDDSDSPSVELASSRQPGLQMLSVDLG